MLSKRFGNNGKTISHLNKLQEYTRNKIKDKIKKGIYSFENFSCCVCDNKNFEILSEKDRYGLFCPIVICRNCGLIQQNPRMIETDISRFYNIEYKKLYVGENTPSKIYFEHQYKRGEKIFNYIKKELGIGLINLKILEVGCGAGGILKYFEEKNNKVFGIDLESEYIKFGKEKYNLDLKAGSLNERIIPWQPDIVIYSHVIEHILNPVEELNKLRSLIDSSSYLYIEAPGVKSLEHSYGMDFLKSIQNAHIYYFTLKTLKNILQKTGYDFICGDETIYSIFKPSLRTVKYFQNDYDEIISYLKRMEWYRFLPTLYHVKILLVNLLKILNLYNFYKRLNYKIKQ